MFKKTLEIFKSLIFNQNLEELVSNDNKGGNDNKELMIIRS